ncbi:flavodoxin family protein [Desulfotomaculum defluvii]
MFILAINGSPRKNGRISKIINEILAGATTNNHVCKIIYLIDLDIKDCTGCMNCQLKGACIMNDDIKTVEEDIKRADLIIWGSPTHWANISGLLLRTFERLFGFFIEERPRGIPQKRQAHGKKAILVTTCSTPFPFNWIFSQSRSSINRMREICKYSGQEVIKTLVLPGTLGMKEIPETFLAVARKVGRKI